MRARTKSSAVVVAEKFWRDEVDAFLRLWWREQKHDTDRTSGSKRDGHPLKCWSPHAPKQSELLVQWPPWDPSLDWWMEWWAVLVHCRATLLSERVLALGCLASPLGSPFLQVAFIQMQQQHQMPKQRLKDVSSGLAPHPCDPLTID